ncbi:MAG: radical SAM protein [Desulfohalobiaceae bacterium]
MRIVLVSANTEQITMPVLPVGMARVAAAVESAGHEVKVLNLMRPEHVSHSLDDALLGFEPHVIGISVRNIDDQYRESPNFLLPPVKQVVEECRRLSRAPIVLGGPGYSIFPQEVLEYLQADYGIRGEGEHAFPLLLDRLERGLSPSDLPGLVLPREGEWREPQRIRNLDGYPLPQPGRHLHIPAEENPEELWVPFQTRRGCPMCCSYCSTPFIEGGFIRRQSVAAAVDNLKSYAAAGYKRFFFVDNTFNLPPSYAESLCDAIIEAGLDIAWQAIIYPVRINPRLAKKMARAGCVGAGLGFESGSPGILRTLNKRFSLEDVRQAARVLADQGISRMGFLLLGGPGETRETVEQSLEFADSLNLELMKITPGIRIYPHTALAEEAIARGLARSHQDLLHPTFYLEPELDGWLQEKAARIVEERDNWQM